MSILNQLFNRGVLGPKCKTCLTLAISRMKLLQNKRDLQLKLMRKEIAQFLHAGQEAIARIRVEHIIREQNTWAAYGILEMFCEFVLARIPILESQRECPLELREAVASIIFAAPRCSDLPDLLHVRNLFAAKYGKEFIAAASELRPDSGVNRTIVEKLSVQTPSPELRLKVLKEIAREHNVVWDSSKTEEEFSKKPEDLLNGPKQISTVVAPATTTQNGPEPPYTTTTTTLPVPAVNQPSIEDPKVERARDIIKETGSKPSDAMERAQAAIAAANRATAAARAAAELVNVNYSSRGLEGKT